MNNQEEKNPLTPEEAEGVAETTEAAEVADEAGDGVAEVTEAADDIQAEVTNGAEAAEEALAETEEVATEAIEDAAEEVPASLENTDKPVKNRLFSPLSLILCIVLGLGVIALAIMLFVQNSKINELQATIDTLNEQAGVVVFDEAEDKWELDDISTIEVNASDVAISDETIDSSILSFVNSFSTTDQITEGTVAEGDTIYIDYVGTIDGETFEGGSTEGTTIVVGQASYIDGFESGLVGANIGDTVVLDLTFPESYSNTDLAGKDVQFTVTIYYKSETTTPELTDEFVKENSLEYFSEQIDSIEDLRTFIHDYMYKSALHNAMFTALQDKITVTSRDSERLALLYDYALEELSYYASSYGMDADTLATYYGYESSSAYATNEAEYYSDLIILFNALSSELGISYTEEEINEKIAAYMNSNGFSSYTVEEFKEASGETWLIIYEGIELKYDDVLTALEDRVVVVESSEEDTAIEETTAE